MWIARPALALVLAGAPAALPHPHPVKPGLNACATVPAKMLAAAGVTARCQSASGDYGGYGTDYRAIWNFGNPVPGSTGLYVSIVVFDSASSPGYTDARAAIAGRGAKRVPGIGTVAYQSITRDPGTGGDSAHLDFVEGSRTIVSTVLDSNSRIKSLAPLHAIARAIAKRI